MSARSGPISVPRVIELQKRHSGPKWHNVDIIYLTAGRFEPKAARAAQVCDPYRNFALILARSATLLSCSACS